MDRLPKIESEFLDVYPSLMDCYESVALLCSKMCEDILKTNGIKAIISHRAKTPESLRDKFISRVADGKTCASVDNVQQQIIDLAGARIALYFPGDIEKVSELVKKYFDVVEVINHPISTESRGIEPYKSEYKAKHFRIFLKSTDLEKEQLAKGYDKKIIELQVATVLMHAWSEVEHDFIYKPKTGTLSEQELDALNQLNSLMLASELSLRQFDRGTQLRTATSNRPFENHYELASYIFLYLKSKGVDIGKLIIGPAEDLLSFLRWSGKDTPEQLNKLINDMIGNRYTNNMSVAELIIQAIINEDVSLENKNETTGEKDAEWRLEDIPPGSIIKASLPMLYWYGKDCKRYPIPTTNTFLTWYPLGSEKPIIRQLPDTEVVRIPIGGNVTYRPGTKNLKIASSSFKYAVSHGRVLHLISDSIVAVKIFGENWEDRVDTIPDAFLTNYIIGKKIETINDFDPAKEQELSPTIDHEIELLF